MGGYGSGRPKTKRMAEDCHSLDVNRLHKDGCLQNGWRGNSTWYRYGQEVANICCRTDNDHFILDYKVRQYVGDWEPVTQAVLLTHASCNYGGQRPYFQCSGVVNGQNCGRRVAKLFCGGKYFLCRHCYRIAYTCQSEGKRTRMLRSADKLRTVLGGEAGTANWIAPKPKGMWQRTYQRKRSEIESLESQENYLFLVKYAHLLTPAEREMYFGGSDF
jgi:hypothetical protein